MVRLSGYGVQLAVKSTEYKAVDDTKIEEGRGILHTSIVLSFARNQKLYYTLKNRKVAIKEFYRFYYEVVLVNYIGRSPYSILLLF